jgi:hypothetical protein
MGLVWVRSKSESYTFIIGIIHFREAQNCRDKKTLNFFFAFPISSGKYGKESLRVRAAKLSFLALLSFCTRTKIPRPKWASGDNFMLP